MKNSLWIIIVIIVAFVSFIMGYSRPHPAPTVATKWSQPAK